MNPMIEAVKAVTAEETRELNLAMDFIPVEKHNWCAGGCAKTPLQIYLECAGALRLMARLIQGKPADRAEGHVKPEDYPTYKDAKALMEKSLQELNAALDSLEESRLAEIVEMPWGMKMPMTQVIFLGSYHTSYHNGQLNYIQTLLGDSEFHF